MDRATSGLWTPHRRALTTGLVLTITFVALETLAVATILPDVEADLGGLGLYGWVFSAFFLGSLVGVVVAGEVTDHRGPAAAYLVGLGLFIAGLVAGGLAPSMLVLVLARAVQGFGAGAVPATAYATIGRAFPEAIRPRVFAILSTAWVVPGLLGPGLAGAVSHTVGWRWVFLGLVPFSIVAGGIAYRPLRALDVAPALDRPPSRLGGAVRVAVGAGLILAGVTAPNVVIGVVLGAAGLAVGIPPFLALVPPGTVRARAGMPAAVLARGVLTFSFFAADAYVPLAVTSARGASTLYGGLALTVSAVTWTAASWTQERFVNRLGPRRFVGAGHAILVVGIAVTALVLWESVPLWIVVVGWAIGGFGIGLAYAPISLAVLREAPAGQEGAATAGMQLTDLLGVALGTGLGGATVALGDTLDWDPAAGIGLAWAMAGVVAVAGIAVARRLPGPAPAVEPVAPAATT